MKNLLYDFLHPHLLSIEEKIFVYVIRLTLFIVLIAIPINLYIGFPFQAYVCIGLFLMVAFWYYLGFIAKLFHVAVVGYSLMALGFLSWFWFLNGGSDGSIGIFFMMASMIFSIILPKKIQKWGISLACLIILTVTLIEYQYPFLVEPYRSKTDKVIDLTLAYIVLAVSAFFIMSVLKNSYDNKEKSMILKDVEITKQNEALAQSSLELSKQNEQLQKMNASQTRLFSIIAHDLRSPLTSSKALVELVYRGEMPLEQLQETVPDIYRNLSYTLSLVDNLLFWAKNQFEESFTHIEPLDLNSFIESQLTDLSIIASHKSIRICTKLDKTQGAGFHFDKQILEIVLRNIFSNAVKFSFENKTITLQTVIDKDYLKVQVIDEGIGISEENLENIRKGIVFSSKGTQHEKGTGLGLNLCQSLLKRCQSALEIESTEKQGTTVSILIPLEMVY